ncbi:MAG: hypothetical protein ACPG7F_04840 [Aggregatilineales bacterium]
MNQTLPSNLLHQRVRYRHFDSFPDSESGTITDVKISTAFGFQRVSILIKSDNPFYGKRWRSLDDVIAFTPATPPQYDALDEVYFIADKYGDVQSGIIIGISPDTLLLSLDDNSIEIIPRTAILPTTPALAVAS